MIRRFAQFLSAVAVVLLAAGCSMTNSRSRSKDQVVFQVSSDDAKTWNLALNNAKKRSVCQRARLQRSKSWFTAQALVC